jgi:hypothetical protein
VVDEDSPNEKSPDEKGKAAPKVERESQQNRENDVGLVQKPVKAVPGQILHVRLVEVVIIQKRLMREEPKHMRPPEAVPRAVGIPIRIRKLVMKPVASHPVDRIPFCGQDPAHSEKVL